MLNRILTAMLVLSLAAPVLAGCGRGLADTGEGPESGKPVKVEVVGRTDMDEVLTYVADLIPSVEVKIYSPVPDRILYFPWKNGDEVKVGQRIALIRKEGLDKGLEQIVAQMEAVDVQIGNLKSELERSKGLLKAGVITQQTYDKIEAGYLSTLAQKKGLEAGRGQLAVTAGNAVINAPISGVIANKMLERGDIASPQFPLCKVMTIDKLKANLKLVESDVHKVRMSQEVEIEMACCPGRPFKGSISRIFPYLDSSTRTNTVEVSLDNPVDPQTGLRQLKPGMYGEARLLVSRRQNVLAAPEPALLLDNELLKRQKDGELLRNAFVVNGGSVARKREVRLGARKGGVYEVLDGLSEGDRIIVRGQHGLRDGQKVEVVAEQ